MITFSDPTIKIDQAGIHRLMTSESEPVARHMWKLGTETAVLAKTKAGKRTGRLIRSIKVSKDSTALLAYAVFVGSDVNHALIHHQGARPHIIRARGNGMLRFRGRNGMVFARAVQHPGHAANRYLTEALEAVIRA